MTFIRGVPNINRRHTDIHVAERIPSGLWLNVGWEDEKRRCAYAALKRRGFLDFYNLDTGELVGYGTRNPLCWRWDDDVNEWIRKDYQNGNCVS